MTDLLVRPQTPVEPSSARFETKEYSLLVTKRKALLKALCGFPTSFEINVIRRMIKSVITFSKNQWSNIMLGVCIAGFIGVAGFALSLADNYRCVEGEHVIRDGQSAWAVASQRCSGDVRHAMHDILALNGGDPIFHAGDVIIVPASGG